MNQEPILAAAPVPQGSTPTAPDTEQRRWQAHLGNWRVYATAAGATLAATSAADAAIVTGNLNIDFTLPGWGTVTKPFSIGGVKAHAYIFYNAYSAQFLRAGVGGLGIFAMYGPRGSVADAFRKGNAIGGNLANTRAPVLYYYNGGNAGNFPIGKAGFYLGFQLPNGDIGDIAVEFPNQGEMELTNYAYNDVPGAALTAGEAAPEPTSMALLALGAAGVLSWRRRREQSRTATVFDGGSETASAS